MINFSITDGFAHIIDGKKVTSPTTQGILNPATEEVFAHVPVATREQLDEAITAAERAFPSWSTRSWEERQGALNGLAALLEKHAEQFTELLMREVGKDRASAMFEVAASPPWLRAVAKHKLEDQIVDEKPGRITKIRHRPIGVCAGITPFNYPILLVVIKMSHAVLAGNCLILKAPPTTPCTVQKFIELAQGVFPPGVLSVLCGGNDLGQWLVQHPRIMRVSLTGSTSAGKSVMREAAADLKSITLELGGNDPAIVLDDVDPKKAAETIFFGSLHNAGQVCFSMKRIYLHDHVYDAVRDELVALAQQAKMGNPFDPDVTMGPVQNKAGYIKLRGLLADCKENGYKIAFGGEDRPADEKGYFIPLTIVDNPPDDSRIVREEQFGPIVPLIRWSNDDDVVRRANDSEYGFSSTIWGRDMDRIERIADGLYNGSVWINEWASVAADSPMSGTKHSGIGVEGSKYGLSSWTYIQSLVCTKPEGA